MCKGLTDGEQERMNIFYEEMIALRDSRLDVPPKEEKILPVQRERTIKEKVLDIESVNEGIRAQQAHDRQREEVHTKNRDEPRKRTSKTAQIVLRPETTESEDFRPHIDSVFAVHAQVCDKKDIQFSDKKTKKTKDLIIASLTLHSADHKKGFCSVVADSAESFQNWAR